MDAVLKNDPKSVAALIEAGVDVNGTDVDHISALRLAVVAGRFELVKLLLAKGAMPDMAGEEGVTALMDACAIGHSILQQS